MSNEIPYVESVYIFKKQHINHETNTLTDYWYVRFSGMSNGKVWFFENCSGENPPSTVFFAWAADKMKSRVDDLILQDSER